MFQRVIIHLLMLANVLCPLNCTIGLSSVLLPHSTDIPKCSCCASHVVCDENQPVEDRPTDGYPENKTANCICQGALVSASLNEVEFEWQTSSCHYIFAADFLLPAARIESLVNLELDFPDVTFAHSGIFVRISHQSLLI